MSRFQEYEFLQKISKFLKYFKFFDNLLKKLWKKLWIIFFIILNHLYYYFYANKYQVSALTTGSKASAAIKESNKRFIYPNKEIIRVIIFSAINLLSIKKEEVYPSSLDQLSIRIIL